MPRYAAKVDKNQGTIVSALVSHGCDVMPMHSVGGGFPDLLWYKSNVYGLIEVKCEEGRSTAKYRDERCLTPRQKEFHSTWNGPIDIVWTEDEAKAAVDLRLTQ